MTWLVRLPESASRPVLFEGQSVVVQRRRDGWDQCHDTDPGTNCEECEGWKEVLTRRASRWLAARCGRWVLWTMFPHGCATAQVCAELVSIAETSPSQVQTHGESKKVALAVVCHAPVWFEEW